ncbi:MAG: hypothetical protein ACYTFY_14150, partial [Planctomycetota bacterium]
MSEVDKTQVAEILLADVLDVDDFLTLKHLVRQCSDERKEAEEILENFSAKASSLSDKDVRETALRWALGEDISGKLSDSHALTHMMACEIADSKNDYAAAYDEAAKAAKLAPTSVRCALAQVAALRHQDKVDKALEMLDSLDREFSDCAEFMYQKAR